MGPHYFLQEQNNPSLFLTAYSPLLHARTYGENFENVWSVHFCQTPFTSCRTYGICEWFLGFSEYLARFDLKQLLEFKSLDTCLYDKHLCRRRIVPNATRIWLCIGLYTSDFSFLRRLIIMINRIAFSSLSILKRNSSLPDGDQIFRNDLSIWKWS